MIWLIVGTLKNIHNGHIWDLNLSSLLPKSWIFGCVSNFSLKSSWGQNRWPRKGKITISQFHGVPGKKLLGFNPQIQNSIRSGPPKSSKTNFEEFHYVEFWRFEAIYDFQSEPLLLLMTGLSKLTKVGGIWTISWYMKTSNG